MINRLLLTLWIGVSLLLWGDASPACEMCAIYGAANASGDYGRGLFLTASEQYTSAHNLQYNSRHLAVPDPEFLDSSLTHLVLGYNFSPRGSLSLSVPI